MTLRLAVKVEGCLEKLSFFVGKKGGERKIAHPELQVEKRGLKKKRESG